jgi:hypothetical protein
VPGDGGQRSVRPPLELEVIGADGDNMLDAVVLADQARAGYEWLDAQDIRKTRSNKPIALKHLIERWAGRYASQADVEIAACLHPRIKGRYPNFNLSNRLVLPSDRRLEGIGQAITQDQRDMLDPGSYARREEG